MKSMRELILAINCWVFCFVTVSVINLNTNCQAQTNDTLHVLFEKGNPHILIMNEKESWHYAYFFKKDYYWGFEPTGKSKVIKSSTFKTEIVNFDWLNQKRKFQSQSILKCPNIFITEKIGNDSLKITPVRVFTAIE